MDEILKLAKSTSLANGRSVPAKPRTQKRKASIGEPAGLSPVFSCFFANASGVGRNKRGALRPTRLFFAKHARVGRRNHARALVGRLLDGAHVSNNDAPTFGETNPSLRLAPDLTRGSRAVEKGRCHCKVATKGGDHGPRQGSGKAGGRTRRPERCDFLIAVQVLRLTVAHRARIIAEYLIECRDVVGDHRPLIPFKGCANFRHHIRTIDLQFVAPR
jgi:hypothetical protein